jgi:hypothetical protein
MFGLPSWVLPVAAVGAGVFVIVKLLKRPKSNPSRHRRRRNPAGLTAKGERMYRHIRDRYEAEGDPRAKEIAARTVYARARRTRGLVKKRRR